MKHCGHLICLKKQKERHKVTFFATSAIKIHYFITLLLFFFLVQLMSAILPLLDYNSNNDTFASANSERENVNFSNPNS